MEKSHNGYFSGREICTRRMLLKTTVGATYFWGDAIHTLHFMLKMVLAHRGHTTYRRN